MAMARTAMAVLTRPDLTALTWPGSTATSPTFPDRMPEGGNPAAA
jgi:hypothetical protein